MLLLDQLNVSGASLSSKLNTMTNILIPTDFSQASFQLAEQAILAFEGRKVNITLFHVFQMPDPFDLLDRGRKMPYRDLLTESFRQSCKQLKETHNQQVQKINFSCMEGNTSAMFKNFIEANEIDFIVYPEQYRFIPASKLSVDPGPLFRRSGISLIRDLRTRRANVVIDKPGIFERAYLVSN